MTQGVDRVVAAFGVPKNPRHQKIPKRDVFEWMQDGDIEVVGAVYGYLSDQAYASRIEPPLSFDEVYWFALHYYERSFRENPTTSRWANTRYEAGRDLTRWFIAMWQDSAVPRTRIAKIKEWLTHLYKSGDDEVKECIVNAVLEHLFENPAIARYWEDWKDDPLLSQAYADALLWSQDGGSGPPGS